MRREDPRGPVPDNPLTLAAIYEVVEAEIIQVVVPAPKPILEGQSTRFAPRPALVAAVHGGVAVPVADQMITGNSRSHHAGRPLRPASLPATAAPFSPAEVATPTDPWCGVNGWHCVCVCVLR